MKNMTRTYLTLFPLFTFLVFNVFKSASSGETAVAAASSVAVSRYQDNDPIIDALGVFIGEGLLNSPVLGSYARFEIPRDQVYDLQFRAANKFVEDAGIYDPKLAKIVAQAAKEIGRVNSRLFFYANGYTFAKFMKSVGILSPDTVDYLGLSFLSEVELAACSDGVFDTQTTMYADANGFFNVLVPYGLTTYDDVATLCRLFADELKRIAGKY